MTSGISLYAYEDEPYWTMCLREYIIPTVVFALLAYYLVFHTLLPMRRFNRPIRQTEEEGIAAAAITNATDGKMDAKETLSEKKNRGP